MNKYIAYFNYYIGDNMIGQNSKEYETETKEEAHELAKNEVINANSKRIELCMLVDKI